MSQNEQPGLSRLTDPVTSQDAAEEVDVSRVERKIVARLKELADSSRIGETTSELVHSIHEQRVSISPRMRSLEDRGLLHDSGTKRRGIVWAHGPRPAGMARPPVKYKRRLRAKEISAVLDAAVKIRDYLEAKPQLTLEASVILNDHLNPALEAVGRPSGRTT